MFKHLTGFIGVAIDPDLLGFYEYEDNLDDSGAHGRNITAPNGIAYTAGKIGSKAGSIDGVDQYTEFPALADWDDLDGHDFSVLTWYKGTDKTNFQQVIGNFSTLVGAGPTPDQYWGMNVHTNGKVYCRYVRDNGAELKDGISTTDVSTGVWRLLSFIKRGLDIECWIDDTKEATGTLTSDGASGNDQPVRQGVEFARYLDYEFDNTRLFKRALVQAEITAYFNE